jgi:hypothetical protein
MTSGSIDLGKSFGGGGSGGGVTSLNSQTGALSILPGTGIGISPGSGTLTIVNTTAPLPFANTAFVNSDGDDSTGQINHIGLPFLTIPAAMAAFPDYTVLNQIIIQTPGVYSVDGMTFNANIFLEGSDPFLQTLDFGSTGITMDPVTWSVAPVNETNTGGITNLGISAASNATAFDFSAITQPQNQFNFNNIQIPGNLEIDLTGSSTLANISFYVNNVTQNKGVLSITDASMLIAQYFNQNDGMSITCTGSSDCFVFSATSSYLGDVTVTGGSTNRAILLMLSGAIFGTFTLNGSNALCEAQLGTMPAGSAITNTGGTLFFSGDCFQVAYTPANPSNWAGSPVAVQDALDRIAAVVGAVTPIP